MPGLRFPEGDNLRTGIHEQPEEPKDESGNAGREVREETETDPGGTPGCGMQLVQAAVQMQLREPLVEGCRDNMGGREAAVRTEHEVRALPQEDVGDQ